MFVWKDENKWKRGRRWPILKKWHGLQFCGLLFNQVEFGGNRMICTFFCKTIYSFQKRDTKITQTNDHILLTNVSIKRCIRPGSEPTSSGGGKSSNQTSTLQTITRAIQVIVTMFLDSIMNYYLNFAIWCGEEIEVNCYLFTKNGWSVLRSKLT